MGTGGSAVEREIGSEGGGAVEGKMGGSEPGGGVVQRGAWRLRDVRVNVRRRGGHEDAHVLGLLRPGGPP